MPKTASRRAKSRRAARVTRAHQTTYHPPVTRKIPAARRRQRPRGFAAFVSRFPVATGIFSVLLVGGITWLLYSHHVGPFAVPPKVAHCTLKTHVCDKPPMTIDKNKIYLATIKTAKGDIVIQLDAKNAPTTVNNFVYLAHQGFYNGLTFHRVLQQGQPSAETNGQPSQAGIIQGGDPKGDGTGGPGYSLPDENMTGAYTTGAVAMARGDKISGSQFFICTADDSATFSKSYNVFGQVVSGLDVAQKIVAKDKITSVTIAVENPTPTPKTTATATATAGR